MRTATIGHPETGGFTQTILVNNLIYNPSQTPFSGVLFADFSHQGATLSVLKGNVLIAGPTTPGNNGYVPAEYPEEGEVKLVRVDLSLHPGSRIYLDGNYYEKHCGGAACLASPAAQWMLAKDYMADWLGVSVRALAPPLTLANLPLASALPHARVEAYVTANAGARPLDRDAVDARIIREIATRTGSVPNTPSEKVGPVIKRTDFRFCLSGSDHCPFRVIHTRPSIPLAARVSKRGWRRSLASWNPRRGLPASHGYALRTAKDFPP